MKNVRQLLTSKNDNVWSVCPTTSITEACRLMAEQKIGALVVVESGKVVGIVSERDFVHKVLSKQTAIQEITVGDVMTPNIVAIQPEFSVEECMVLMTENHLRHLPVLDNDHVVGVISIRDVVKEVVEEKEFMIGQLENYITERRSL
ncbi:MAG: CBS domain-containing protein [Chloroflexota bacterium]